MEVAERGDEPDAARAPHAVAEDVAAHVADADRGERVERGIEPEHPEVALDRLPSSPRGDANPLVVVAVGAPRGEGIAEPEPRRRGERVRGVGEGCGSLVGRDHEVRIGAVVAHRVGRRRDLAPVPGAIRGVVIVVGKLEQGADELPVTGDALIGEGGPIGGVGASARSRPSSRPER